MKYDMGKMQYVERKTLSATDEKVVQALVNNARIPHTQLAKVARVSPSAVQPKITSLQKRQILLNPVSYTQYAVTKQPFYLVEATIDQQFTTTSTIKKLTEVNGITAVLIYAGAITLTYGVISDNFLEVVHSAHSVVPHKKLRIRKVDQNYFSAPELFAKQQTTLHPTQDITLDKLDHLLLQELSENPIQSLVQLAQTLDVSIGTIKNRKKRLEVNNVILGYTYFVNPWILGRELASISLQTFQQDDVVKHIHTIPESANIWLFKHEWNINAVFYIKHISRIQEILASLSHYEILNTEVSILQQAMSK